MSTTGCDCVALDQHYRDKVEISCNDERNSTTSLAREAEIYTNSNDSHFRIMNVTFSSTMTSSLIGERSSSPRHSIVEYSMKFHVNNLRGIVEKDAEFRSLLHLLFLEFEKPFDSVNSDCFSGKLIVIIRVTYDGVNFFVLRRGSVKGI